MPIVATVSPSSVRTDRTTLCSDMLRWRYPGAMTLGDIGLQRVFGPVQKSERGR
jgi:hypothetical protein